MKKNKVSMFSWAKRFHLWQRWNL